MGDDWRARSKELVSVLRGDRAPAQRVVELLELINGADYPVAGLTSVDAESVLSSVLECTAAHNAESIPQLALLVSTLLAQQQTIYRVLFQLTLLPTTQHALLSLFLNWFSRSQPPTELLYTCATLTQAGADPQDPEALLSPGSVLLQLAFARHSPTTTQRAALHYTTTLCSRSKLPLVLLHSLLDSLLQHLLSPSPSSTDSVLQAKLFLSLLRLAHAVLLQFSSLKTYPSLATLLAALKANMTAGLPGQPKVLASIQPPLSVTPFLPSPRSLSVAGPHQHRRHRGRGRERGRPGEQHSDPPPPTLPSRHTNPPSYSSSESELSDSEPAPSQLKAVNGKIRHQAHSCLATIFQSLDRHTTFSYWLSFLPDGPRPPNSVPSLLTCILKDPTPKCRGAAVAVLSFMLEGSRPYLAAADDKPLPSQPFTPYSSTLGAVLRELHRSLSLAIATESHPTTLTRTIKCLSLLVANTPYHQLSEDYLTRVISTLYPCTAHRDTDVHVACLTCYGAVMSTSPPLPEVQRWLEERERGPWLVEHCTTLLKGGAPLALQTEALQVLAAVPKFYFQTIRPHWSQLRDLYLSHLAQVPDPLQQHALKMLEELCRALPPSLEVALLWETLLLAGGPLTSHLQHPATAGPTCAQACNVLATIGNATFEQLKVPAQRLALSLPLSLSQDETANATVTASAVRVLGVFVLYDCLREDTSFLLDCRASFLHSLHSPSLLIRTQACWALANLTDALPSLPPPLLLPLYTSICQAMEDNEKVKCNAVRATGNLLKALQEPVVSSCSKELERLVVQLSKCVNSGTMKSRWNACYATHSALSNSVFTTHCSTSTKDLLSVLCVAVQTCKNFKVRSNAALALGSPAHYCGKEQFLAVWETVMQALETSEQQIGGFSEYKHAATLKAQLCSTLCHMCAVMTAEQAEALSPLSLPRTISRSMAEFLQVSQSKEEPAKEADVVERALQTLRSLTSTVGRGEVVHQLLSMLQDTSPS